MPDGLLLPGDVCSAVLLELFEQANMESWVDPDGVVVVRDCYSCYLRPDKDGRAIAVYASFEAAADAGMDDKLQFVNRVNHEIKLIRASALADGRLHFDYYIAVDGGITGSAVAQAVRRFLRCLEAALAQDVSGVVA
jgi:hypothetical protein